MSRRSRFSRRHLLALCTFLVPLVALALLGNSELQRQGSQARAAVERESRQFLASAVQAVDQRFARLLGPLGEASERLLAEQLEAGADHPGPPVIRTTRALRADPRFESLRHVVLLDQQLALRWPSPPLASLSLPFAHDAATRRGEGGIATALQGVDLLLTEGDRAGALRLLRDLVQRLDAANPPDRGRRFEVDEAAISARFRLATTSRAVGDHATARAEFETVRNLVTAGARTRFDGDTIALGMLAELGLAELGTQADRLRLLRTIAEGRRSFVNDGLLTAIAERLAATVPTDDPEAAVASGLLAEEHQRAATRSFAGDYDLVLKFGLRLRQRQADADADGEVAGSQDLQIVSTLAGSTTLLWLRDATAEEAQRLDCAHVGMHIDLDELLAPVLQPFRTGDGTFTLVVLDPDGVPMVPPPALVPDDLPPPSASARGLILRAYPANTERLVLEAQAAARNRTLLLLALLATAIGGALWMWRSVSREAELASMKVDLVSRVSHELKTPLALIRMYGETLGLGRAKDADQAAQFGGIIARESERLTALIQRILDFSRQQAGTLQYTPTRIELWPVLRGVCDAYTPHLEARGAVLVETLHHDVFVDVDANALESAVVNLLENAAKYGIEGDDAHEIELDLHAERGHAVIEVRDRGRGIPDGEWEHVFDSFFRASNAGEVRGAGLGLSLVRHFARAHGGEASAAPRPGGGSVFRIVLPLAGTPAAAQRPPQPDPDPTPPHPDERT